MMYQGKTQLRQEAECMNLGGILFGCFLSAIFWAVIILGLFWGGAL